MIGPGDLPPAHPRRPGLRLLLRRRPRRRGGGRGRPQLRDRRVPGARALSRRPDRPRAGDPQPRRSRVGPRPPGGGHRRDHPHPPAREAPPTTTSPSTTASSSSSARCGCARCTRPGTGPSTRPSPWSTRGPGRRAVGRAHGRQPVRGRRRPARPGRRARAGRPRDIPEPARAAAVACRRETEVWPGHLGGSLCGGPGHGPEGLLHGRLRAPPQPAARRDGRGRVRRREALADLGPQPPNFQAVVDINRGPLARPRAWSCCR